ncbi:unnamed protein product [Arabidopsis lyrata]|nr:unnamed protein product [Arabidopsis lyrata]
MIANVAHRGIRISKDCLFCGEETESQLHLFFQCRFAKEIWGLSSHNIPTDGSWINSDSNAGIGWSLHDIHGRCIIKSYSSVEPTSSVLETEAIALRQALFQLKRLNYRQVTFCGDSATLYHYLEKAAKQSHPPPGNKEIQRYIDDILGLSNGAYLFKFIPRSANSLADSLAKEARLKKSPLVVSWTC